MADKLPRGCLKAATAGVIAAAADFGHGGLIAGDAETLARAALTSAMPVIERAVLREAAKRILLLPGLMNGNLCPDCHGWYVTRPDAPNHDYRTPRYRCKKGHEWNEPADAARAPTGDALLRMLARGEPLPDLPPKEDR